MDSISLRNFFAPSQMAKRLQALKPLCRVSTMGDGMPQMTLQTIQVLSALLGSPNKELSGSQIRQGANLKSGTLYPILIRLEQAGMLTSRWEVEDPKALGRPRRRYYRLTAIGARYARPTLEKVRSTFGDFAGDVEWA